MPAPSPQRPAAPVALAPRLGLAAVAARGTAWLCRRLGRGGTALPGLVTEALAPGFGPMVARQLPRGIVLLTGTNGKTTTARMLAAILTRAKRPPLHNASGSNLARGLAAVLAGHTDWRGRLRVATDTLGLFEVDEAAFARAAPDLHPSLVAFTNLFRDQLDRYGEVDAIAARWQAALAAATPPPQLVLNADDPLIAALGQHSPHPLYFGVDDPAPARSEPEHAADARTCPTCGQALVYSQRFYAHLGHYRCPGGHLDRPTPVVRVVAATSQGMSGTDLEIVCLPPAVPQETTLCYRLPVGGLYNVYNALAATASALALGLSPATVSAALATFTAAFGRMECLSLAGRTIYLHLAKNPAGLNQIVRALAAEARRCGPLSLLMALNDLDADGRDVSWIWDADLEGLAPPGCVAAIVVSGRRAADLALRLKYAGVGPPGTAGRGGGHAAQPALIVESDLAHALTAALDQTPVGHTLHIVPTYTALLELRGLLTRQGALRPYWATSEEAV